jgi:hypothetical protein
MFSEPSSQLFAEYEIGSIDWIWSDSKFLATLPQFLKKDIHFGCFVRTVDDPQDALQNSYIDLKARETLGSM